jgi:hypothetical protein
MWELIALGTLGQLVRSAIGLKKAVQSGEKISWSYWLSTIILGAFLGGVAGLLSFYVYPAASPLIAFLSGYSAVDFIEGLLKKS